VKTPFEYSRIWNISYPIILGSIAQTIINVTDTAFLGRVSEVALGASAIGGILYLAIIMIGLGIGLGAQIIIARRYGEGKEHKIGETFEHAILILGILSVVAFLIIRFLAEDLLIFFLSSDEILSETIAFLNFRVWGVFFAFIVFAFRSFFVGITRTRVITWTTALMAGVNIILDYGLIFGRLGLPEMGIEGAAIASVIAEFTALVFFFIFTVKTVDLKYYRLFYFTSLKIELIFRILRISAPIVLQHFISFAVWFFFFLFVENMGQTPLAISNIIRSVYLIMMLPIWGFSAAANTLVSYLIGKGQSEDVNRVVMKISKLSLLLVSISVIACVTSPGIILSIYTNNPILIEGAIPVLYVVSGAAMIFSVAFVLFNAVVGTGKTYITFIIELGALSIYFIIIYYMTHVIQTTVAVVWTVEIAYAFMMGLFSFLYLAFGKWKGASV
jgi:putative MATE family efflux protein